MVVGRCQDGETCHWVEFSLAELARSPHDLLCIFYLNIQLARSSHDLFCTALLTLYYQLVEIDETRKKIPYWSRWIFSHFWKHFIFKKDKENVPSMFIIGIAFLKLLNCFDTISQRINVLKKLARQSWYLLRPGGGGGLKGHSPEKKEKIGASLIDFHFYDIKMVIIFFNHKFNFDVMVSIQFELAVAN